MSVRRLTAFLGCPPETARATERFWLAVTGTRLSPPARLEGRVRDPAARDGDRHHCLTRPPVDAGTV